VQHLGNIQLVLLPVDEGGDLLDVRNELDHLPLGVVPEQGQVHPVGEVVGVGREHLRQEVREATPDEVAFDEILPGIDRVLEELVEDLEVLSKELRG